jgi:hypothetical protein
VKAVIGEYTRKMGSVPSVSGETAESGQGVAVEPKPRTGAQHSGKLLVRMPATLHDELAHAAEDEGVSLNQFITGVLAGAVDWRTGDDPPRVTKVAGKGHASAAESRLSARVTRMALAANLAVVGVAAILAIVLLVAAWRTGFS